MATAPPLCLDPDPHLVRAANNTLRVSVPTAPASLKRKASSMDPEETAHEKVRRAKIMQFMRPANSKLHKCVIFYIQSTILTMFQLESVGGNSAAEDGCYSSYAHSPNFCIFHAAFFTTSWLFI